MAKCFFFLFSLIFIPFSAQENLPKTFTAKVVGISDGDTFKVLYQRQEYKIRLNHIDTPEKGQDYGKKAKEYASNLCFGKNVKIIWKKKDRYKRILGEVYLGDMNINKEMVRAGYAWHYKKFSKDQSYADLETQARKKQLGLWQQKSPTPPWEWRKNRKKQL